MVNKHREQLKARYQAAIVKASDIADRIQTADVRVTRDAAVSLVDGGAFVEAVIFVPDDYVIPHENTRSAQRPSAPGPDWQCRCKAWNASQIDRCFACGATFSANANGE